MYWANYFYWCFRWTFAVPMLLLLVTTGLGMLAFNALFGVDDGFRMGPLEWTGATWRWCFIDRTKER